jgi:hypothetical protein
MLGPNITGSITGIRTLSALGAFTAGDIEKNGPDYGSFNYRTTTAFNASLSSSIYSDSVLTVQPSSLILNAIIKY